MPTLQFKGRNVIWNHHLSVPYHSLEEVRTLSVKSPDSSQNLLIEGDNLIALKSLLPVYTGRVDCIYIDPPYNTGEEHWIYNDNVNNPMIKEWIGRVVAKDDLTRHDKWLCMMVPRLKILRDLLSDKGSIFVSIDDNEIFNLKSIMDNIFIEANYRNIIVIRRGIKSVQAQFETIDRLNYGVEYVLVYSKQEIFKFKKFEIELENGKEAGWNNHWRGTNRPTMRYKIFGTKPETGQWRWGESRSKQAIENYDEMLTELRKKSEDMSQDAIDAWWQKYCEENGEELDLLRLSSTGKPEHYVPSSETKLASSLWSDLKPNGSSQLKRLFGKKVFENPKSIDLIKRIVRFAEGENTNSIILDSFAGSGSTGQAVMELNQEDGGTRTFIMVQLTEATADEPEKNVCKDITRERIKRAIDTYSYLKPA